MTPPGIPSRTVGSNPITAGLSRVCCLLVSCLLIVSTTAAGPGKPEKVPLDERVQEAGKTFVKEMKGVGRDIKNSETGRAVIQLGRDIRQITRAAWEDTLEARKNTLRELRKKNKKLRRQVEQKKRSQEKGS